MLSWITSWWSTSFSGPARNAPDGGKNIKVVLAQKPIHIKTITSDQLLERISVLKPTIINSNPPISNKSPMMKEIDLVNAEGYKIFFIKLREKKIKSI